MRNNEIDNNYQGYLGKRSLNNEERSKERYFEIIEGQFLAYFKSKDQRLLKGIFDLDLIKNMIPSKVLEFKFDYGSSTLIFISTSQKFRDQWLYIINSLMKKLLVEKQDNIDLYKKENMEFDKEGNPILKEDKSGKFVNKPWKNFNFSKEAIKFLKDRKIYVETKKQREDRLHSKECLNYTGIDKIINLSDPLIKSRICFGFLDKKNKFGIFDYSQSRWFFLISSKPLTNLGQENDENILDEKILEGKLCFNKLYYYQEKKKKIFLKKGEIDLKESNGIQIYENNGYYVIDIDMDGRIYELITKFEYEVFKWEETLSNCLHYCKDMKNSVTKNPKNIRKLLNIFNNEGLGSLKIAIEEEIDIVLKNEPIFGVEDVNLKKNALELINIFNLKYFWESIDNIKKYLKEDRENKTEIYEDQTFMIRSPYKFFNYMYEILEVLEKLKNNIILENYVGYNKYVIIQYISGIYSTLRQKELNIDKEFLISCANGCLLISEFLEEFILKIETLKIFHISKIEEIFQSKEIQKILYITIDFAIYRFVVDLFDDIIDKFESIFLKLEVIPLIELVNEIFGKFISHANQEISEKIWEEILKNILINYMLSLFILMENEDERYSIDKLKNTINIDKKLIRKFYKKKIDDEKLNKIIENLENLVEFLTCDIDMISLCCHSITLFLGNSFSLEICNLLISLRNDIDKDEKISAQISCTKVIENFEDKSPEKNSFYLVEYIEKNFHSDKNNKKDKKSLFNDKKTLNIANTNNLNNNKNKENFVEALEEVNDNKSNNLLMDFGVDLSELENDEESEQEKKEENNNNNVNFFAPSAIKRDLKIEIIMQGYMLKQSKESYYQKRYFHLKKGKLFWFKKIHDLRASNSICLLNCIRAESKGDEKFEIFTKDENQKNYKFKCETAAEKNKWITEINKEIKRVENNPESNEKVYNKIYELEEKKRLIKNRFNFPNTDNNFNYMKEYIDEKMINDKNFGKKSEA